ncbi:MAG: hypothetical protein AB7U79_09285 [Candidatus Izemoplasmatales bacterium]
MNSFLKESEKAKLEELNSFASLFEDINSFVKKNQSLSYIEFDYYVVHKMTLFSIEPDFDFHQLEETIEKIRKSVPAIKRIFSKPIIILKETDDVLPVENARTINQDTLLHLANHTQHVANITKRGVKPRKLLTRHYEDDYTIYENIIFCNYVDEILALVKKNRRIFDDLLYASDIMKLNLLEKVNHMNYFLALGKLHTGYIRDFNQYYQLAKKLLHELTSISQAITPRLYKPVYKKNNKRNRRLSLKKTNIFLMQKDYHQVYKTYKHLLSNQNSDKGKSTEVVDYEQIGMNYLTYVELLTIFAVGHFNFEIPPETKINLNDLDVSFKFKDWRLDIVNNPKKELLLMFFKEDETYKIIITNREYNEEELAKLIKEYRLDEVIRVSPSYEEYLKREDVYISMQDIDSFRRIQQIILKGMIYSDSKRDVCPFCGGQLVYDRHKKLHQCHDCLIQIKQETCPTTGKSYFYTDNTQHKHFSLSGSEIEYDELWYMEKQLESLMYYRNITKINEHNEFICPHCNEIHQFDSSSPITSKNSNE